MGISNEEGYINNHPSVGDKQVFPQIFQLTLGDEASITDAIKAVDNK
jgi:hypothetical protein